RRCCIEVNVTFERKDRRNENSGGFLLRDHQSQMIIFDMTSPMVSSVAAQMKAETKLAIWNCQNGISKMPPIKGTEPPNGQKNRTIKIPGIPHPFMNSPPRGMGSGWRDNGHMCATVYSSLSPIQ